jgi:uncharacterized membrane protein YkoI
MKESKTNWIAIGAVALIAALGGGLISLALTGDDEDDQVPVAQATTPQAAPVPATQGAQKQQGAQRQKRATGAVQAAPVDADDVPISRSEADKVADAALRITGGGTVTDLDRSDDLGEAWNVEVTRDDGVEIDISLDENLNQVQDQD